MNGFVFVFSAADPYEKSWQSLEIASHCYNHPWAAYSAASFCHPLYSPCGNLLERLVGLLELDDVARQGSPTPDDDITVTGIDLDETWRPVFSAAIMVVPDPAQTSNTMSPGFEQSFNASTTIATGLTVGCIAKFGPAAPEAGQTGIVPDVASVAAFGAGADVVDGLARHGEDED